MKPDISLLSVLPYKQFTIDGEGDLGDALFHAKRTFDDLARSGITKFVPLEHVEGEGIRSELLHDDDGREFRMLSCGNKWRVDIRFDWTKQTAADSNMHPSSK